jgi:hypothetical protein
LSAEPENVGSREFSQDLQDGKKEDPEHDEPCHDFCSGTETDYPEQGIRQDIGDEIGTENAENDNADSFWSRQFHTRLFTVYPDKNHPELLQGIRGDPENKCRSDPISFRMVPIKKPTIFSEGWHSVHGLRGRKHENTCMLPFTPGAPS